MHYRSVVSVFLIGLLPSGVLGQAAVPKSSPGKTSQKPPANSAAGAGPQQTKHYPILVVAHGNEPFWSLRLGMKGPERLDRASYPPVVLEPGEISAGESGNSWTYTAKDIATGAVVTVTLTREPCSDTMSDTKYTFRLDLDHAQIGKLKGCGLSVPDKFPEFRKKNQALDPHENDSASKEKDKFSVLDPITRFETPVAIAYLDPLGKVIVAHGEVKKAAASEGTEPALSHDGKKLLFTRSDSKTGPDRSIVLYDFDSGHSRDFTTSNVRQAFWSPDDSRVAFLKVDNQKWSVWIAPAASPEKAVQSSQQEVLALHGWASPDSVLATDVHNAYWIGVDGQLLQTIPLSNIYGDTFQIMSNDTLRICPVNSDLLLVSAYYLKAPPGALTDAMGLNSTFFLYEIRSKRRTVLGPADLFARAAEWSRDGLMVFYSKLGSEKTEKSYMTDRIFWDGTGIKHYVTGSYLVVGR